MSKPVLFQGGFDLGVFAPFREEHLPSVQDRRGVSAIARREQYRSMFKMRTVKATAHFYPPGASGRKNDTYDIDNVR
jgi:hypothetical protein